VTLAGRTGPSRSLAQRDLVRWLVLSSVMTLEALSRFICASRLLSWGCRSAFTLTLLFRATNHPGAPTD